MVRMPLRVLAATVVAASFAFTTIHANALIGPPKLPAPQKSYKECWVSEDGSVMHCIGHDGKVTVWYLGIK